MDCPPIEPLRIESVIDRLRRKVRSEYRARVADSVDRLLARNDPDDFRAAWDWVSPILHWDHRPSARRLWNLARHLDPVLGTIVEIGSFLGNSTIYLALAGGEVHAVDPHSDASMAQVPGAFKPSGRSTSDQFIGNLEQFGVRDRVCYHRTPSIEAARTWAGGPIRLLYVDGLHEYQAVLDDFDSWRPHLAAEHVVLFDDYLWPEVAAAVNERRRDTKPNHFYVRGGQAMFSTSPLPLRVAGLP